MTDEAAAIAETKADLLGTLELRERTAQILKAGQWLRPAQFAMERELSMSKWFDHRFISPVAATLVFSKAYSEAFKQLWRANMDAEESVLKLGTSPSIWDSSREFVTLWNARQKADELGIPYSFFVREAMEAVLRRAKRKRFPRPGQLYDDKTLVTVVTKWEEAVNDTSIGWSRMPHYKSENAADLPHQRDHERTVLGLAHRRFGHPDFLGRRIYLDRTLSPDTAAAEFGHERIEDAKHRVEDEKPIARESLSEEALRPGCFAIPHANDPAAQPCRECRLAIRCARAAAATLKQIERRYGSQDPVTEHKRRQQRERTRRFRERRRLPEADHPVPETSLNVPF